MMVQISTLYSFLFVTMILVGACNFIFLQIDFSVAGAS